MLTSTDTADPNDGATVFARIPELLDDAARRTKYDIPLANNLTDLGVEHALRGFQLPATPSHAAGVGVEVRVAGIADCALIAVCLANLGAPPETLLEYDTVAASVEMSLADALGK